ncbi:hypothetical protein A2962_04675 [Candidatus Woesebacteria bacterium RIFCSPLOWO2_01_FULL_39_61]|uniref:Uncharacterized protein n=1 Tax=Candidatus Woesebacteria bacterium RIFCSPHIGHO2_02_FULL_39_13 TaxID=1802505 RepID=A0A1F7Z4C4_9BACT|nr:MAG: hypothetical protein A2692_00995 [Candidatus Woesebacteria bacterium RIFCSPHIGHO2_01_FULL_39_95]OGM34294.1 MAG: hypothetical protein A3D01_00800 [Candidatus Woesebacteria bacterium RIFCSPHIGHO2_02_FULL_39_13]OGM39076.1 MAG: hypothetical protein A3E13_01525 [Candidatus Woesebacteria bacterium RIFCSPHIGHO2_12_FULL_40_20]OGM68631.1 MAG: hypothetical protein A2962_04675 [Candidatus Woesebacteria bacterium RIFCSPLOWO2_01_FULL_39_61]OGM73992.1 MAG: hypothetical protein A3H19_00690 [Candidatus
MALAEIKIDCSSDEHILGQVKDAWVGFIESTSGITPSSLKYSEERSNMVRTIRSVVPENCYNQWTIIPDKNDLFERPKIDQVIDEVLYSMQIKHPAHPAVVDLIQSKAYWRDFVALKENKN